MISEMEDVKKYAYDTLAYLKDKGTPVSYDELDAEVFKGDYQLAVDTKMWMLETGLVDNESPPKDPDADPTSCMRHMVTTESGVIWHGAFNFPYIIAVYDEDETEWGYRCKIVDDDCIHDGLVHCDKCEVAKKA